MKLGQGYVFTRVCDSVHGGVCPIACWDTHQEPEAGPHWEQTPPDQAPLLGPGTPLELTNGKRPANLSAYSYAKNERRAN